MLRPCSARALPVKLLIAGGGTGGHVFPSLAIAQEWLSRANEREVVLVGTQRGIEMKLVPQAGLPLETLRVAGVKGKGGATLLRNLRSEERRVGKSVEVGGGSMVREK